MNGFAYLYQPCEVADTNIYTVGVTRDNDFDNVLSKSMTNFRMLSLIAIDNPDFVEEQLKIRFSGRCINLQGSDYLIVDDYRDENKLISLFFELVTRKSVKSEPYKISDQFPNFNEDVCFGGSKKLIRWINEINESYDDEDDTTMLIFFYIHNKELSSLVYNIESRKQLEIIRANIEIGQVYDLADTSFTDMFVSLKKRINVVMDNINDYKPIGNVSVNTDMYIIRYIITDCIVNDVMYGFIHNEKEDCDYCVLTYNILHGIIIDNLEEVDIDILGDTHYRTSYIKKYVPQLLLRNGDGSSCYLVNAYQSVIRNDSVCPVKYAYHSNSKFYTEVFFYKGDYPYDRSDSMTQRLEKLKSIAEIYKPFVRKDTIVNIFSKTEELMNLT